MIFFCNIGYLNIYWEKAVYKKNILKISYGKFFVKNLLSSVPTRGYLAIFGDNFPTVFDDNFKNICH